MPTHELKSWPMNFEAVMHGGKRVEIRRHDRPFAVGDEITLKEWDPKTGMYTGRGMARVISHIEEAVPGLEEGYVALSVA